MLRNIFQRQFHTWDRPSQIGFIAGLVLFVVMLVLAFQLPLESRAGALGAAGAVWLVTQMVVLWANRGMVTPYTRAQRFYLQEDFDTAIAELETLQASGKADEKSLTLLGNTYRQVGRLDESEEALRRALEIAPNHHFPLYGFGRTLLVKGDYIGAAAAIESALQAGAPLAVKADLGEALYRADRQDAAAEALREVMTVVEQDPQRRLMVMYLLYRLGKKDAMPDVDDIEAGVAYWEATAARFRSTAYGNHLEQDVTALKQHTGEK